MTYFQKILLVVFTLTSINSVASKKDGIYFSVEEYKNNKPSLSFDLRRFAVESKSSSFRIMLSKPKFDEYLQNSNLQNNGKIRSRNVWCVVNKGVMYVNHGEVVLRYGAGSGDVHFEGTDMIAFVKIIIDGHICLTSENKMFKIYGKSHTYPVSVTSLKKMIKEDSELLGMYKKERKKEDNIIPYIKMYNERNPL